MDVLHRRGLPSASPTPGRKAQETPPCGIVYRRSSNGETFPLKASLTWEISWTGTGQAGAVGLPDGTIEAVQDITVEEIQAVNR